MKICRYFHNNSLSYGIIEGDSIRPIADIYARDITPGPMLIPASDALLLAPVSPSKIVCVGRNYKDHAAELGNPIPEEPLLFLKAPSAIIGSGQTIKLPVESERVEHEGELGVVIGRKASHIDEDDDPLAYVLGYTCVNDVTARDLQKKDGQFTRSKSFDTFCPVGPFIVTDLDASDLRVRTKVNGVVRQQGRTSTMAFPVSMLIRYISNIMTLFPGDLIATGTPSGVSGLKDGDTVEVEIDEIGTLWNPVKKAETAAVSKQIAVF